MTNLVIVFAAFGIATLALGIYRIVLAAHEDNYVHLVPGEQGMIAPQTLAVHRINLLDRWGIALTILTGVLALCLAAAYLYQGWLSSFQIR
jgi:hypothetical protein